MPSSCYSKALREPIHFLWERRVGPKSRVAKLRSRAAIGLRAGRGELVYDHAIPFSYLQEELLSLTSVTDRAVAEILKKFETIVLITKAENARLNAAGYAHKMPQNWNKSDPLARYKALDIELVENS